MVYRVHAPDTPDIRILLVVYADIRYMNVLDLEYLSQSTHAGCMRARTGAISNLGTAVSVVRMTVCAVVRMSTRPAAHVGDLRASETAQALSTIHVLIESIGIRARTQCSR
eukprot:COSAG02_NODE_29957_length_559_cov_82.456522_1_plen_111_part_00